MQGTAGRNDPIDLRDLGFGKRELAAAALAIGVLPASLGLCFGLSALAAAGVAGCSLAAGATVALLAARHFRRGLVEPIDEIIRAMEQLRSSGRAPRITERGAPLLQPLMRRFNLAGMALDQRGAQSNANLQTVEAAFDRVHAVLQSLREGVVVVDPEGRVVLANRNARRLLGFGDNRLEGAALVDRVTGELRDALVDGLQRVDGVKVGELHLGDVRFDERIFDLSIVQVKANRPDQDFGKVVVVADVTRHHELNHLKDELLSSISHELRTPLTNMCSSSEILTTLTAADEGEWREFVDMLSNESRRLKNLVDDVMQYSLLESDRLSWNIERCDMVELVGAAIERLQSAAEQKAVKIRLQAPAPAYAMVDAQRTHEVLCRIIDNAVKFTPASGQVDVAVRDLDGMVEVAVDDSGPGVAPADRLRVFERFIQTGDVMTDKPDGTGLGLSIAQRIVDAMGGTIWCEDSELGGAQFRFVVPQAVTATS